MGCHSLCSIITQTLLPVTPYNLSNPREKTKKCGRARGRRPRRRAPRVCERARISDVGRNRFGLVVQVHTRDKPIFRNPFCLCDKAIDFGVLRFCARKEVQNSEAEDFLRRIFWGMKHSVLAPPSVQHQSFAGGSETSEAPYRLLIGKLSYLLFYRRFEIFLVSFKSCFPFFPIRFAVYKKLIASIKL